MILIMSITVFITQLIFLWGRTLNVRFVASDDIKRTLISGTVVHLSWLVSIGIGGGSVYEIISTKQWDYWPVIFLSLVGSLIGSYLGMKRFKIPNIKTYLKPKTIMFYVILADDTRVLKAKHKETSVLGKKKKLEYDSLQKHWKKGDCPYVYEYVD